jgi:hypothetical protein
LQKSDSFILQKEQSASLRLQRNEEEQQENEVKDLLIGGGQSGS